MRLLKRLLAVVFVLLSVVGFGLCVAGVVGAWWIKQPLLDKATRAFAFAGRALDVTDSTLDLVKAGMEKARDDLTTIRTTEVQPKDDMKPGVREKMMSRVLAQQLGPRVQQVRKAADIATEASIVMNSLLDGLNQLPQVAVSSLETERLEQVRDSLSEITGSSKRLSDLIELSAPAGDTDDVAKMTADMVKALERVLAWIAELRPRVVKVQSDVAVLKPRVLDWIQKGPVVVSVVLGWLALSQVIVFVVACSWFRSRTSSAT